MFFHVRFARMMLGAVMLLFGMLTAHGTALEELRLDAQRGDSEAQIRYGSALLRKSDVTEDELKVAARYFEAGCLHNDPRALFNLGICYERGLGVELSPRMAADLFRRAGEQKIIPAQFNYALALRRGLDGDALHKLPPLKADPEQAAILLLELAGQNFTPAVREYAVGLLHEGKSDSAFALFQTAARDGDAVSMRYLGDRAAEQGDSPLACTFYAAACEKGDIPALGRHAWCLQTAFGCAADSAQAVLLYQRGVQAQDALCMSAYAELLLNGEILAPDTDRALALYVLNARLNGDVHSVYRLACFARDGVGQNPDRAAAERFFKMAVEQNHVPSLYEYARFLLMDEDVQDHIEQAVALLEKAADADYVPAILLLARLFADGAPGLRADPEYAHHFRLKAHRLQQTQTK